MALVIGAANRDETRYENGDSFDVERVQLRSVAFGEGIHHCIGAPVARMEGQLALETVLRRCPNYQLAGEPTLGIQHNTRGFAHLPVELSC